MAARGRPDPVVASAAPGPLACPVRTRHLAHGLHEEDVEVWDSAGVLCAQSRQLAVLAEA